MGADVIELPPPSVDTDEPVVPVYRLDWTGDNLPHPQDVEFKGDTAYYAHKHAAQVWPHVQKWLDEVPGSDVLISLDDIPLSEWLNDYLGEAEDAEP